MTNLVSSHNRGNDSLDNENASVIHSVVSNSCHSIVACQAPPLPMGFSRQEYRSGWPFPPSGGLPDPVIKLMARALAGA